uniref:Putative receptor-like serine/threonine-protein kinase n=1 Tax=Populus alba TaxID=43335 RepID=A0A4U5QJ33_POPAL|nr:putative receptor-like serine/threonine-protein kinase [Populus alba]
MKYIRTNSLRRLFSLKRRSLEDIVYTDEEGKNNENSKIVLEPQYSPRPSWKCFSFEEISDATNSFSPENLVGRGGYAEVYKGVLGNGEEIAIKRLTKACRDERKEKEFLTEIGTIGHISDFGLAKWLPSQWTHHSIAPIEGTFGHLAPEYYMHGIVDEKTDVFAFGVFLLEIISGRKPVDGSHQSIHVWAKPILNQGEIEKLVDPRLGGTYDATQQKRLGFAASLCIRASSTWRPTMSEVLEVMLEEEMDKERWKIPKEDEQEQFWGFEDLEHECDSSCSVSPQDSISTRSTMTIVD